MGTPPSRFRMPADVCLAFGVQRRVVLCCMAYACNVIDNVLNKLEEHRQVCHVAVIGAAICCARRPPIREVPPKIGHLSKDSELCPFCATDGCAAAEPFG